MTKNNYIRDGEMTFLTITSDRFGVLSFIIDSEDVERVQEHKLLFSTLNDAPFFTLNGTVSA